MPENVYLFLRNVIKNITTPYEYHEFEKVFSFELAQLNPHQYEEIMSMYERKKSVLMQEKVRAENVLEVGMYYLYQAFTDDKRITQMAEKLYSMLDYYQEKADENGISLYEQLMREFGSKFFFELKIRILPPRAIRELSPPPSVGLVKKKEEEKKEEEEEEKQKGKEELPVVAIPPEIIERLNSIEEELLRTKEKIDNVFSSIVEKINASQQTTTQETPKEEVKTTTQKRKVRREFSDEVVELYKRYVGISMNDINLAVFNKFINTIKQMYYRRAVEMKDLQSILDEVDFNIIRTAILKRKSISEAYNEALKDLTSKIRPDTMTEEKREYEEAREESGIFDRYGERLNVLVEQLQDLRDEYKIAQEQNDVNEMNNVREIMRRMFYVETDEDFKEAMENPYEYIVKKWDMFFR